MARIRIDLPDRFNFETILPVRVTDLNYGNHVGNDTVLSFAHEARVRFLESAGFSEKDVGGVGLTMADAAVVYGSQGRYGQHLRIQIAAVEWSRASFDLVYVMCDDETGLEVARVKTGMVFFDYDHQKVVAMPADFRSRLGGQ